MVPPTATHGVLWLVEGLWADQEPVGLGNRSSLQKMRPGQTLRGKIELGLARHHDLDSGIGPGPRLRVIVHGLGAPLSGCEKRVGTGCGEQRGGPS